MKIDFDDLKTMMSKLMDGEAEVELPTFTEEQVHHLWLAAEVYYDLLQLKLAVDEKARGKVRGRFTELSELELHEMSHIEAIGDQIVFEGKVYKGAIHEGRDEGGWVTERATFPLSGLWTEPVPTDKAMVRYRQLADKLTILRRSETEDPEEDGILDELMDLWNDFSEAQVVAADAYSREIRLTSGEALHTVSEPTVSGKRKAVSGAPEGGA